jgi:uncharacterized membrane protein YbhN (UPF0104 family)
MKPTWRRILGYLLLAVIFFFLGRTLYHNWEQVRQYDWTFNYPLLALSLGAVFGTLALYAWQWKLTLNALGADIGYGPTFRIWFIANLGRYVPGKVWQFVGWFYLCEREGVTKVQTLTSIAVNQVLQNMTGLALSFVVFALTQSSGMWTRLMPLLVLIPLGVVAVWHMEWVLNRALQLLGREPVAIELRSIDLVRFAGVHLLGWLAYGWAFYLFVSALHPVPLALMPSLAGVFAGAYVIGFVSLLTPGGLGVREGALTYLLGLYLPPQVALVVALLSRLWITAAELVGTGIALRVRAGTDTDLGQ